MNPFAELSQIPTVSDSPEETPEDLLRQQMMQRLGVALNPQAVAQKAAAERLGQTGQGVGGWLQRILGGAAEGVRFAQDPKYRGAFAEELTRAQEQEKNLMPYARQLEMSSAMREKARLEAREKERATAAKVFATIKQDAQAKIKNTTLRAKVDQEIEESEAKIKLLQSQDKFNEAREELQRMQNKLFEKIGRTQASEAMSNAAMLQDVSKFTDMTGAQAKQGLVDMSLAKAAGPAVLKLLGAQGGPQTRTTQSTQLVRTLDDMGREVMIPVPKVSTSVLSGRGGGGGLTPGMAKGLGLSDYVNPAESAPAPETPTQTPASILGAEKPKPRPTPPALGLAGPQNTAASEPIRLGWGSESARQEHNTEVKVVGLAQDIRSNLGTKVADIADSMGAIRGNDFVIKLLQYGKALNTVPEFKKAYTDMMADMMQNRVEERLIKTGKASNMTEMQEIARYLPNINDTFQDALIKSTRLEILGKMALERKDRGYKKQFPPGRLARISDKIFKLYQRALTQQDPKERREMLKNIDKLTDSKMLWELSTASDADVDDYLK